MLRTGRLMRMAAGPACLIVACTVLTPGMAAAATYNAGPIAFAGMATQLKTVTSEYSCDLSNYGSGIPSVTLSATLKVPGTAAAGSRLSITLSTPSTALPSAVLSKLNGVTSVDLTATVTAQGALVTSVPLSGQGPVSGQPTGLPAEEATGSVTFPTPGTGVIDAPAPTLTFTPHTSTTALNAITCTTTAATQHISVTVTPLIVGKSGPLYKCAVSIGGISGSTALAHVPMTITSSGTRSTGHTLTVTLSSPNTGLGGPYLPGTTSVSFAGTLPVHGAQSGEVALAKTTTDVTSTTFRVSGKLWLTKPGTDRILDPDKFTFTLRVSAQGITLSAVLACTIDKSPAPVGLTVKVTGASVGPHPTDSPTPTSTDTDNGGSGQGSGTPVGAPNTGGGSGPGGDMAVAIAGLAMLLAGGGLMFFARRRARPTSLFSIHSQFTIPWREKRGSAQSVIPRVR